MKRVTELELVEAGCPASWSFSKWPSKVNGFIHIAFFSPPFSLPFDFSLQHLASAFLPEKTVIWTHPYVIIKTF